MRRPSQSAAGASLLADVGVATVEMDGSVVTVGGIAHGVTTVTVTAVDNRHLRVSQSFEVSVGYEVSFASTEVSAPEGNTVVLRVVTQPPARGGDDRPYVPPPPTRTLATTTRYAGRCRVRRCPGRTSPRGGNWISRTGMWRHCRSATCPACPV